MPTTSPLQQINRKLRQRTEELAAVKRQFRQEILRRRSAERALKSSQCHCRQLQERSRLMREQLRNLSRQIRLAQSGNRPKATADHADARRLQSLDGASGGPETTLPNGVGTVSSREIQVLQRVAEGQTNKQTASDLGISVKTVEKHRQRLMDKLNIHNTAGLTRYAIAAGISEGGVRMAFG